MAASFERSSRSRRRTSVTSRSRIIAPVTDPWDSSGMQCTSTITSGRRSTSSTTGRPVASAHSTADSSTPSSVNRRPSGGE